MLICSGLNFDRAFRADSPVAKWLIAKIIEYIQNPQEDIPEIKAAFLRQSIAEHAPFSGPFYNGYGSLLENQGDEVQMPSYRENKALLHKLNLVSNWPAIKWITTSVAPTDKLKEKNITFVFAGGFSRQLYDSNKMAFRFLVNDEVVLDFNPEIDTHRWNSHDGKIALFFNPYIVNFNQIMGLFYITLPTGYLSDLGSCHFGVQVKGKKENVWFGLNPYSDVLFDQ